MPDPSALPRAAMPRPRHQLPESLRPSVAFSCRELCHLSESLTAQDSAIAEHLLDRSVT
ncbi:hypothetical protein [Pontibaca salina]|uniref:Uncharacterized protein n=1 Tax=Pontibaca salina TaxID=2795731 RepID=A0A934HPF6_9RHOB|nr:hypothetical protein [Pontibaca salina]MBI6630781.1 hypothetical protein [Pontibaca salina]